MRKFRDIPAGKQVTAAEFNSLAAEVERQGRVNVKAPMMLSDTGAGVVPLLPPVGFWAMIIEQGGPSDHNTPYAWQEVSPDGQGGWTETANGLSGTTGINPAYEVNKNPILPCTIVWLTAGTDVEYLFSCFGFANNQPSGASCSNSLPCGEFVTSVSCSDGGLSYTTAFIHLPPGGKIDGGPCTSSSSSSSGG